MSITFNPSLFDLLFFLVLFLFSLDFTLSGILILKDQKKYISKPFLVGLWTMKRVASIDTSGQNKFSVWLFSVKVLAFSYLLGGVLIIFAAGIMIVNILLTKTLFSIN